MALYEGVYGRRPFVGEDAAALRRALLQDRPQDPPKGSVVPPKLWKVLRRGLARDPAARYPAMDALLAELSAIAAERPMRPWQWALAAGSFVGVLGGMSWWAAPVDRCGAAGEALAAAWTPEVRGELQAKFAGAAGRWARVESALDDYVTGWQVRREAVCAGPGGPTRRPRRSCGRARPASSTRACASRRWSSCSPARRGSTSTTRRGPPRSCRRWPTATTGRCSRSACARRTRTSGRG
ncbi:hypothetical protein [Nannocystis pusilla]|uniref:hypothetical protein n=1 Tax=Nannocystis pusilla TaxID=889268 RepID=UPI003B76E583